MLGMEDGWISLVWWLCIFCTIGGVILGLINWNYEEKARETHFKKGVSNRWM